MAKNPQAHAPKAKRSFIWKNAALESYLPYIALVAGMISLGMSAIFVRWADAPGPITGFYRLVISTILLTPLYISQNKKNRNHSVSKPPFSLPIWGGVFIALDFAFWNTSIHYTTAGVATLFNNTAPLWVALGALLIFKERLNKAFWIGLALTLSGAVFIIGVDFLTELNFGIGDILAVVSGIFYGAYFLISQRGREHFCPMTYLWLASVSAAVGLFLINFGLGHSFTGYAKETWLAFLGAGILSQTIGYFSITYALGHLPASLIAPSMIGHPIMTTLFAIPFLGEIPNTMQLLGGSVALVGIFLINLTYQKTKAT